MTSREQTEGSQKAEQLPFLDQSRNLEAPGVSWRARTHTAQAPCCRAGVRTRETRARSTQCHACRDAYVREPRGYSLRSKKKVPVGPLQRPHVIDKLHMHGAAGDPSYISGQRLDCFRLCCKKQIPTKGFITSRHRSPKPAVMVGQHHATNLSGLPLHPPSQSCCPTLAALLPRHVTSHATPRHAMPRTPHRTAPRHRTT